jgi:hypothetical protein
MNPVVDFYFSKEKKGQQEINKLRTIIPGCGLGEELKWGYPGYTFRTSAGRGKITSC